MLGEFVKEGKIRFVGLSNETPWGVMTFLKASERLGLPRVASIQNAYNLVNRSFETGLSEISYREGASLWPIRRSAKAISPANMRGARCHSTRVRRYLAAWADMSWGMGPRPSRLMWR